MNLGTKSNRKNRDTYNRNDCVMTPDYIAEKIVNALDIKSSEVLIDPFFGKVHFTTIFQKIIKRIGARLSLVEIFSNITRNAIGSSLIHHIANSQK